MLVWKTQKIILKEMPGWRPKMWNGNAAHYKNQQLRFTASLHETCIDIYLSRLKYYRFEISATLHHLGWIDAPHSQNFEILESLKKTQE
jgi:uncharacterized Fe-S radical SAM superfamily protein PflX